MSNKRYPPEFKDEAVRQIVERGYSIADVSERLGVSAHSLYKWVKAVKPTPFEAQAEEFNEAKREVLKLRAQLRRTEEGRDISKKGRAVLCQGVRVKYRFFRDHPHEHPIMRMCRVLRVARSGFYAWLHRPTSDRDIANQRLLGLIRASYEASSGVYGTPRVFLDLREVGERCGKNPVARLMRLNFAVDDENPVAHVLCG